ncbi:MAG: cyclic nucleotide-binding domain-containing protein [Lentisphaerae bacterium]|nr:cyclic nucleotide-binding domain-containing protein [Lentisphaerota bacterium]
MLKELKIFAGLSDEELAIVSAGMARREHKAGYTVFREGELGDAVYIVASGLVDVSTRIAGDVEKNLLTLRTGGVFGELALLTGDPRSATATTKSDCVLLSLTRDAFSALCEEHGAMGQTLLSHLVSVVAKRLNITTELYRQAVAWGLNISNVVQLSFDQLIADHAQVAIEVTSGRTIVGTILKVEQSAVGHELLLQDVDDDFVIIPYQAVVSVSFPKVEAVSASE